MTRDEKIIRDFRGKQGDVLAIAARYGISKSTVNRTIQRAGVVRHRFWNDAEIQVLKRHYKRDKSASQIANMLGRTRNEIIGAAHRHIVV